MRLVLKDVPRHVARELDHKALRELQKRALHFQLDVRKPEAVRVDRSGAPGRKASLADTLRESLRARNLPNDVERDAFVALGLRYLEQAEESEPAPALPGSDA